jgi:hypothetical protein
MLSFDQPPQNQDDSASFRTVPPVPPGQTYVGQIRETEAVVVTEQGEVTIVVSGECVVDGAINEGHFDLTAWRRVALVGRPQNPDQPGARSIGIVSLVGPVGASAAKPALDQVNLQLHYEALSTEQSPYQYQDDEVAFPAVETIATSIGWTAEATDSNAVALTLDMKAEQAVDSSSSLVKTISLESLAAQMNPVRDEPYRPVKHHSLTSSCLDPNPVQPLGLDWQPTLTRLVPVVFVSLCSDRSLSSVQALCEILLANLCPAWRQQGALDYVLSTADVVPGLAADVTRYHDLFDGGLSALRNLSYRIGNSAVVYFVDNLRLQRHEGGGWTVDPGVGSAYCVLDVQKADKKPYLLTHEIGHVLGLDDPNGSRPNLVRGEANTVMDVNAQIHTRNRLSNCRIFSDRAETQANGTTQWRPHNPIVTTTENRDYFRPDL